MYINLYTALDIYIAPLMFGTFQIIISGQMCLFVVHNNYATLCLRNIVHVKCANINLLRVGNIIGTLIRPRRMITVHMRHSQCCTTPEVTVRVTASHCFALSNQSVSWDQIFYSLILLFSHEFSPSCWCQLQPVCEVCELTYMQLIFTFSVFLPNSIKIFFSQYFLAGCRLKVFFLPSGKYIFKWTWSIS